MQPNESASSRPIDPDQLLTENVLPAPKSATTSTAGITWSFILTVAFAVWRIPVIGRIANAFGRSRVIDAPDTSISLFTG